MARVTVAKGYPANWKAIRARILTRAGNCCEGSPPYPDCRAPNGQPHPVTGSKVVLTIAHWPDPAPGNVSDRNLRSACQRCHLAMDRPHHLAVQRKNRAERKRRLQPPLELEEQ